MRVGEGAHRHVYTGMWAALRSIHADGGVSALFSGASINMLRSAIGTPVNLTAYTCAVHCSTVYHAAQAAAGGGAATRTCRRGCAGSDLLLHLVHLHGICHESRGMACSCALADARQVDVVRTRLYNQPHLYRVRSAGDVSSRC